MPTPALLVMSVPPARREHLSQWEGGAPSLTRAARPLPQKAAVSSSHFLVPVDVVIVHPRERPAVGDALEDRWHHQVPQHPSDGAGCFAVARPRAVGDDAFHPPTAQLLVGGERPSY